MNDGNWTRIDKNCKEWMPKKRRYTKVEALVSLQIDLNNGTMLRPVDYSRTWRWDTSETSKFLRGLFPEKSASSSSKNSTTLVRIIKELPNEQSAEKSRSLPATSSTLTISSKALKETKEKNIVAEKPETVKPAPGDNLTLPEWLPLEAWAGYLEMRTKKKAPNTKRALQGAINNLDKLRKEGDDPGAVLDQSTFRAWVGLFQLPADVRAARKAEADKIREDAIVEREMAKIHAARAGKGPLPGIKPVSAEEAFDGWIEEGGMSD